VYVGGYQQKFQGQELSTQLLINKEKCNCKRKL
jgi:hypothetical protein